MTRLFILFAFCFCLFSCGDQSADDEQIILDYIAANNLTTQKTDEGIYYIIDTPGNSEHPSINSKVTVNYKGYFLDDTMSVFDQSDDTDTPEIETAEFPLWGNLIEGWKIGIPLLSKGGSGTFLIPSEYAYGSDGRGTIPGNTVLAFDVTLVDFD